MQILANLYNKTSFIFAVRWRVVGRYGDWACLAMFQPYDRPEYLLKRGTSWVSCCFTLQGQFVSHNATGEHLVPWAEHYVTDYVYLSSHWVPRGTLLSQITQGFVFLGTQGGNTIEWRHPRSDMKIEWLCHGPTRTIFYVILGKVAWFAERWITWYNLYLPIFFFAEVCDDAILLLLHESEGRTDVMIL